MSSPALEVYKQMDGHLPGLPEKGFQHWIRRLNEVSSISKFLDSQSVSLAQGGKEKKKKKFNLGRNVTPIVKSKNMPYAFGFFCLDAWALSFKCSEDT